MARGNPLITEEKLKEAEGRFDPNLRDEGAGFFSTLFTAGSNLGSDAVTELGYIAQAVARPIDTGEAVLRVLAGYAQKALPDDWEAYLPEDWATNKVYANAINDYYAEKYGSLEQAADSFAEQPISVALDAFAVKALLTTVSKQAAKKAATTSKMADTAKGTVMEGELASRAAAELKVAQELERTVKYEGKLVWDDALGAYVPESSVTKPAKIDAAEVAPIIDDIEAATPSVQPAVANLNTEGMMRATRNQAQNPLELNEQVLGNQLKAREPVAFMDGTAQESIAATKAYNEAAIAASKEPISYKGTTVAIADDLEQAAAQDLVKRNKAFEDNALAARIAEVQQRTADANKLARDKQRMDDDAAMAAAIQDDLFTNASPAAYENYQATRLAALADDTAIATAAPKGMMATRATGPISRTKDIDIPPPPSVPKLTAKPESASRGFKDLEINPSRVLPAAQRVAAAASQTGLQGERGTDGSFLPELPDRGIDIDQSIGASVPEPVEIIKSSEKPGWYQGVTKEDDDDGNYWSADFEDEHWNTPAGVQEAIGIWGRPVGNRIGQRFN
jgi:hypothetical protein